REAGRLRPAGRGERGTLDLPLPAQRRASRLHWGEACPVTRLRPADWSVPVADPHDLRVGLVLGRELSGPEQARCVLVGFPADEGVRRNGGRPGAAHGPSALRRSLARLTPDPA